MIINTVALKELIDKYYNPKNNVTNSIDTEYLKALGKACDEYIEIMKKERIKNDTYDEKLENILENFEWTDKSVIDFVNWFLDLHKLPFRYKLENMEILESFMMGDDFSVWH